jgi:hypothetical protein
MGPRDCGTERKRYVGDDTSRRHSGELRPRSRQSICSERTGRGHRRRIAMKKNQLKL